MMNGWRPFGLCFVLWLGVAACAFAEDGYDLWLRYRPIEDPERLEAVGELFQGLLIEGRSATLAAAGEELRLGLGGLLGRELPPAERAAGEGLLIAGTPADSPLIARLGLDQRLAEVGTEGFLIFSLTVEGRPATVIAANEQIGVLYGAFHLLRLVQTGEELAGLRIATAPRIGIRMLNHWDNVTPRPSAGTDPSGTVTRGYAGASIWNWDELPGRIDPRMIDYARANASLGINGTTLNNVNAEALSLSAEYLAKAAALANAFRPYGIRVYLSARFTAPMELGGLKTADPLDAGVQAWWRAKADEIYSLIPDFGGFVIKANSEGQPGPEDYGRSHVDGAQLLADALAPHGGVAIWRAFVYDGVAQGEGRPDRITQSYDAFKPHDGQFRPNVFVQVKSGPLDFQPREPVHPLFGAMPRTPLMMEFQITQEYLGQSNFLAYLGTMWQEILSFDTHARGAGSTVGCVIDGSLDGQSRTGIAGVANIGRDRNWCGHLFGQSNWYGFGRLAWDHELDSRVIAEEWTRMTFGNDPEVVATVVGMMMDSWEIVVDTKTPLGLPIMCERGNHYVPAPQIRQDYHRATADAIGYDRTRGGSKAVDQYHQPHADRFNHLATCPEKYLLWFHHVSWDHRMASGRTLWEELCARYEAGAEGAVELARRWEGLRGRIDDGRHTEVAAKLEVQQRDAALWRDTCLGYFQKVSGRPLPASRNRSIPQ